MCTVTLPKKDTYLASWYPEGFSIVVRMQDAGEANHTHHPFSKLSTLIQSLNFCNFPRLKFAIGRFQLRKVPKFHFTYLYLSVCNTLILSPNLFLNDHGGGGQ